MKKLFILLFIFINFNLNAKIKILNPNFPETKNIENLIHTETNKLKIKSKINKYLIYKGYTLAYVNNITVKSNNIFVSLNEGRLKEVKITGNFKISQKLLNVYLKMKKGDVFNKKELRLQIKKLYAIGLFDTINYKLYPDKKVLLIKIKEKKKRYLNFSGNISSRYGIIPYGEYIDRNLFNTRTKLNLSAEIGIWEKIKFQKYEINYKIREFNLHYLYRNGIMYMAEKEYSEEKNLFFLNKIWILGKYSLIGVKCSIENHYFYNIDKITNENIFQGKRYGFAFFYKKSNRRDVIEKTKENIINFSIGTKMLTKNKFMSKFEINYKKYFSPFLYWGIIYKNSSGYIYGKYIPFDEKFSIGGENQRGFYKGAYWSITKIENSFEIEYEVIMDKLFISLFCDTSILDSNPKFLFLISNGVGIRMNIWRFRLSLYYGVPTTQQITQGEFHLKLEQLFY